MSNIQSEICDLGIRNQVLISKYIDKRKYIEVKTLQRLDEYLRWLLEYKIKFNFIKQVSKGKTLLVGEGNLSFSLSLTGMTQITPSNIIATVYGSESKLSSNAKVNSKKLKSIGVTVLHDVDATNLARTFAAKKFDNIIFQFPNVGSRVPAEGRNPNFILVRNFLKSAAFQLENNGVVLISAVDNTHYRGAFCFDEAANDAGFQQPLAYEFDPLSFPGYEHSMTLEDESAIDEHNKFSTWVFKKK